MADIVLTHGLTQGAWCWDRVRPFLEDLGHTVHTPNLVSIGGVTANSASPAKAVSMLSAVATLNNVLDGIKGPCVVLGHDVSAAIALQSSRFCSHVDIGYIAIAGVLPRFGESICGLVRQLGLDTIAPNLWECSDKAVTARKDLIASYLFHDSRLADVVCARRKMGSGSLKVLNTPMDVSDYSLQQLRIGYICCIKDRIMPISAQHLMIERYGIRSVVSHDCGHAPYFRYPEGLAQNIHEMTLDILSYDQPLRRSG